MTNQIILNVDDINTYLSDGARNRLKHMIHAINQGRKADGKTEIQNIEVPDYVYDPFINRGKY